MSRHTIALGNTPLANGFLAAHADRLNLAPQVYRPISRAFRPMLEHTASDICEMAVVTAIQAVEAGCPIIALPLTMSARFQHSSLIQNARFTTLGPRDLVRRRVAVRAYSLTTAVWVRAILEAEYGVDPRMIEWVTQEGSHVAGAPEPENVVRDPAGRTAEDLLREGQVAAGIFGNDMPTEGWASPVIARPEDAALASLQNTGVVQINHVLVVANTFAHQNPARLREIATAIAAEKAKTVNAGPDLLLMGAMAMRVSVEALLEAVVRQGLTRRHLSFDDVFGRGAALLAGQ